MPVVGWLVTRLLTYLSTLPNWLLCYCSCEYELVLWRSLKWLATHCADVVAGLFAIEVISRPYPFLPVDIWASCVELSFQMGFSMETGGREKLYRRGARKLKVPRFAVGDTDLKSVVVVAVTLLIVWSLALLVPLRGGKL